MGLGKSLTAVRAARALRRKTIIVCPAHVRGVWERPAALDDPGGEVVRWWPSAHVATPYGLKALPFDTAADVVVIHYDIIHAWVDALLGWFDGGTIIFDEAHVLLSPTSRRAVRAASWRVSLPGASRSRVRRRPTASAICTTSSTRSAPAASASSSDSRCATRTRTRSTSRRRAAVRRPSGLSMGAATSRSCVRASTASRFAGRSGK